MNQLFSLTTQKAAARAIAVVTILALILSAFPAAFFVANAADTPQIEPQETGETSFYVNEEVPFTASRNGFADDETLTVHLSSANGGAFSDGNGGGNCTGNFDETSVTIAWNKSNKAFCYQNANSGVDTITATFVSEQSGEEVGSFELEIEALNDAPEYFCKAEGNGGYHMQTLNPVEAQQLNDGENAGLMGSGVNANNIIPPFGDFAGYNWNDDTEEIFDNDCETAADIPAVDFCDPSQKPGGVNIAQWHAANDFDGDTCFEYTEVQQCGSLDMNLTDKTGLGFGFDYVIGTEVPTDWQDGMSFPVTFDEDEYGGSVDVTYYMTGPESDWFVDSDIPNYWALSGVTVTVDTDCEKPVEPPRCENLLTNGSFEEPAVTNNSLWQKFTGALTGWVTQKVLDDTDTTLEIHRGWSGNDAAEGEQYAELDGDHSTKISQTVTTIPGAEYELSWAFAPRHNIAGEQNQLSVLLNNSVVAAEGPATGAAGLAVEDWTLTSIPFTADSESTTITFADAGPSDSFGTFLDDAQLCLVREPEQCEPEEHVFADNAVDSDQGLTKNGGSVAAGRSNPSDATGDPDWSNGESNGFYSLGFGGSIVVSFDKYVADVDGDDLSIHEATNGNNYPLEKAMVEVSQNGTTWYQLTEEARNDSNEGGDGVTLLDFDETGLTWIKYVRITDTSDAGQAGFPGNADGFDLDTVDATYVVCDEPDQPEEWVVISGQKFHDLNQDGDWTEDEPLLSGVEICLENLDTEEVMCKVTNELGYYIFPELEGDTDYEVTEVVEDPWVQTAPESGSCVFEDTEVGTEYYCDFGNYNSTPEGKVKVFKWVKDGIGVDYEDFSFQIDDMDAIDFNEVNWPNKPAFGFNYDYVTVGEEHEVNEVNIPEGYEHVSTVCKVVDIPQIKPPKLGEFTAQTLIAVPELPEIPLELSLYKDSEPLIQWPDNTFELEDEDEMAICLIVNKQTEPQYCELEVVSDTDTVVVESNMYAVETYEHDSWADADEFETAEWIWTTEYVENPGEQSTSTFMETFEVQNPTAATLEIWADNWYKVYVNGELVADRAGQNSYQDFQKQTFESEILDELKSGSNTLLIEVINTGAEDSNQFSNPAGLLYKLTVEGDENSCAITTEPAPESSLEITDPLTDGQVLSGTHTFKADYQDADDVEDTVYWAIRAGSCNGPDMAGNAPASPEPHNLSTYDPITGLFSTTVDMSGWSDGDYCLVVNPKESGGHPDLRDTRTFILDNKDNGGEEGPEGIIVGVKWNDLNGDGVQDDNEPLLSGWTIEATNGDTVLTAITDGSGAYEIAVPAGEWTISEQPQSGWTQTGTEFFDDPSKDLTCVFTVGSQDQFRLAQNVYAPVVPEYRCDFGNQENPTITTITTTNSRTYGTRTSRRATPQPLVLGESVSQCEFLKEHMQMGTPNDRFEVMKLQMFLSIIMGYEQPVTGFFGAMTDANVKRFQATYSDEILNPWNARGIVPHTNPTGFVYKLTKWKINDIVCPGWDPYPSFEGEDLTHDIAIDVAPIPD